jgi:hypothetical protein
VDNYIDGGYMGISYLNTVYADSGLIQGNHITNFKQVGIVSTYDHHLVVRENDILDSTFIQGNRGIESSYCGIDFMNNRVVIHSDFGIGVYLRYSQDTTNARKTVSNNAITMVRERSNGNTNWGMSLWYADNQNIYFNSIWIVGPNNGASRGITITNSSNAVLRNNSVVNASGGYAMWAAASNTISSSNYNNFYSSGGNQIYGFGTNYTSVSAWNSGTGHDANSTSANANYMTAYEMRPNHIALDSTGTPITGFNTDIEGVTRGARPDMGAYEFNTRRDDAGVVAIKSKKICNGTQSVVLAVKNFGGDTLKTARVNWAISHNGGSYNAQTPYNWTGILPPGEVDSNVVVGTFNFTGGDYKLRTFTSIPNAKMDELPDNDSLHGSILVKLSGTYTLGDTASDFRTWNSFADAINAAGVCGAVTLKAMPKLYNESFELNAVEGLSNTFDLTILPDTGNGKVVLEDTLPVVRLNSMSYTTIRGVEVRNTGAQSAVLLEGENQYITLDSNVLVGGQNGSNNFEESVVLLNSGSGNRSHSIQLNGNTIKNGSYGVYLKGASFFAPDHGIEINGNRIQNFYAGGVYAFASDSLTIDSNVIQSKLVNAGNGVHGIYLNHADYFQITKNRISLVGEAIAATGITALNSDGSTNRSSLMLNNFVHAEGGHGISLSNSDQVNVYYNSVHITKGKYIAGHAVRSNSSSAVNFTNNSFANLAGGYVYYNYSGFSSNYNNLYTTGQLLSNNNVQSLAMWQSNTSQDANSVSADPIYLSKADLHANQTLMDSSATVLGSFNEDIDGETRDGSFPDMGADEFDLIKNVGIVEVLRPTQFRARKWTSTQFSGNDTIEVVVRNFGPDVMDIPIAVEFNGRLIQDTLFGTLTAGRLDTFRFAQTVNLDTVGTYNLRVYTAMPNDQYIENDTLNTEIVTLENAQAKLPFEEDFEGVKDTVLFENYLGLWDLEEWDFETNGGRLQTKSGKKSGGEQAITLDRSPNGPVKANELTLTLNMSRYDLQDSVYLDFDFIDHRDERHKGDSVWVRGSDTSAWVGVYDLWRNRRTNRTKEVRNIEVTSALVSANQNFSSSFQVRFGQEDNQRLPGDGRTFDNIKLWAVLPYDLAVSNAVAEYRQVPSDMANNRFQATVTNLGYNQADSVKLNAQVLTAFNDELLGSLMRDQDSTASLTDSMHVRVAGVYTAELFASFNRTEKCPENDSAQVNFSITDTVLARDDNVVDSTFGFSGSTGQMGTILEVFETDTITSVSFYLNFPTIGDTVQAHIYTYNNQVGNRELSTEPMVITSNAARWYTAPIKCLQTLKPGKYLVAVEQTGSYLTLGITRNNYMQGVSWINTGSAWNSLEDTLGGYLFNIHANFGEYDLPNIFAPKATCINSSSFALKTNKPGGQWSGTGVKNDSIFDPALAGYGTHVVRYSLQAANGCFDTNEVEILVDSIPTVSFVNPADLCDNDQLTALTGGTPAGGLYFGNGVTANRVNPAVLGAGTHTLNYTYARPVSGCADTASAQINIKAAPNVSFASVDDFCVNENPKALTQGNPVGGIYSGNGISNDSIFDPQAVGVGVYTIQYAFTAANACSDSATQLVTVNDTPSVNLGADTNLCPNQVLRLSASSIGTYLWSTGDTSEHLSVNTAGTYWHKTTNTHGCSNTDTIVVTFEKVCIGLAELESQGTLKYYPNPSTGMFTLELKEVSGPIQLTVRNVSGQVIRTYEWTSSSDIVEQIDLRDQARGIYFFDLQTPLGRSLERVTISR